MGAVEKNTGIEVFNGNPLINLNKAYVTEIVLNDGTKTQMVTFFNTSELNFEEVNIGIRTTVMRCYNTIRMKNTLCRLQNGIVKPYIFYEEYEVKHSNNNPFK